MPVMVALLRGVNVGGRGKLPMADLREVATDLGYDDVATYIQSGNLVLRSSDAATKVAKDLAAAIAELGGVKPAVMVRSRSQLAKVVDANPFLRRGEDASLCHVTFMETAASGALTSLDLEKHPPDEANAVGKELYLFLPSGMGRSKLAADLARNKKATGTTRNWRTVTTLLGMMDGL